MRGKSFRAPWRLLSIGFGPLAALLIAGGSATADPELARPWPGPSQIADIEGQEVSFPSHSPFGLPEVGTGPEADPPETARGTLFLPESAAPDAPVPAVVMLHGASGVLSAREMVYGRQLASRGVAALVVDVFAARRGRASGFVNRLLEITEAMFLADAFAGLRFLDDRPDIDGRRVVLVGFSYGGMVATYAAYAQVAERFARGAARFAGHVAFYAPCLAEFEDHRATGASVLMLFGARDAIVDPERCAEVAQALSAGGADVQMIIYNDAVHQWDGHFDGPREIGRNLAGCHFTVRSDGSVRGGPLDLPMTGRFMRKVILGLCADTDGYLIGRDDRVRQRSNGDLGRFLERVFRGGGPRREVPASGSASTAD
ncbi:MAG TPA: alpha/beta fold hydrolase [Alphaproteobacteria bacterium]|jgi:dienelactone hydrolase